MEKTVQEQMRIITKGAANIVNVEILEDKLRRSLDTGKPLTVKLGLDPSAPDIHLGHAVVLRKIRQLQDLGHRAVIVIGDFTGRIGDPTGKSKGRKALTAEEVQRNAETYTKQIFKILDEKKTQVRFNSEWLSKLNFEDVLKLAATTTVARILERDDFSSRYKNGVSIGLHEFFYPLMQGFDSVELQADIELGGTDQTFNILMGRTLQKSFGQEEQVALFMPILEGLDGIEKMSKSLGNYIGVHEPAEVMFKKVMEVPDHHILKFFELATDVHPDQIDVVREALENGQNPRDLKLQLAKSITALYHCEESTLKALKFFESAFQKNEIPEDLPEIELGQGCNDVRLLELVPLLMNAKVVDSKSSFRRLLQQGGVQVNQQKVMELDICIKAGDVMRIGKKKFLKFV